MQLKKISSFIIAALILFSNLGLAFGVHYCNDEIASISFQYEQINEAPKADTSCCKTSKNHAKCCSDKLIKVEKKTDKVLFKTFQLGLQQFTVAKIFNINFIDNLALNSYKKLLRNYSESNSPPLYKLYCQLVLYA